jgi:predicted XRE-type DNA-binding protein
MNKREFTKVVQGVRDMSEHFRGKRVPGTRVTRVPDQADSGKARAQSVFHELYDDHGEAPCLELRAQLMAIIDRAIKANGWTQQKAAEFFGTAQPRISDLQRGRIEKFSIDLLVEMVERAGWTVDIKVKRKVVTDGATGQSQGLGTARRGIWRA